MPRRSAFKLFGPCGAPLIRQSRKPFRMFELYHSRSGSVKRYFKGYAERKTLNMSVLSAAAISWLEFHAEMLYNKN